MTKKKKSAIKLGDVIRDNLSGFEGVAVSYSEYISNCPRWGVVARKLDKDGKKLHESFDDVRCELVETSNVVSLPPARPAQPVGIGDLVKCAITEVEGVVVSHTVYIDGCSHVAIQPKGLKDDGTPRPLVGIDEKDCAILESANPKPAKVATGGPRPEPMR